MKLYLSILIIINLTFLSMMSCNDSSSVRQPTNFHHYIGTFEGAKLEEYNQQLTYRLSLWRKGDQIRGFIYHQWYVTDTNQSEYTSIVEGTLTGKDLYLKGEMNEAFILVGKLESEFIREIDIKYPKNPNRGVKSLQFKICCKNLNQKYKEFTDFDAINNYYESEYK